MPDTSRSGGSGAGRRRPSYFPNRSSSNDVNDPRMMDDPRMVDDPNQYYPPTGFNNHPNQNSMNPGHNYPDPSFNPELTPPPTIGSNSVFGLTLKDFITVLVFLATGVVSATAMYYTFISDISSLKQDLDVVRIELTTTTEDISKREANLLTVIKETEGNLNREITRVVEESKVNYDLNISSRLETIRTEIQNVKSGIDVKSSGYDSRMANMQREIDSIQTRISNIGEINFEVRNLKNEIDSLDRDLRDLKDYNRGNN